MVTRWTGSEEKSLFSPSGLPLSRVRFGSVRFGAVRFLSGFVLFLFYFGSFFFFVFCVVYFIFCSLFFFDGSVGLIRGARDGAKATAIGYICGGGGVRPVSRTYHSVRKYKHRFDEIII